MELWSNIMKKIVLLPLLLAYPGHLLACSQHYKNLWYPGKKKMD